LPPAARGKAHRAWRLAHSVDCIVRFALCALRFARILPQKLLIVICFFHGYPLNFFDSYSGIEGFDTLFVYKFPMNYNIRQYAAFPAGSVHLKKPSGGPKGLSVPHAMGFLFLPWLSSQFF
jgi:hypothetical protein